MSSKKMEKSYLTPKEVSELLMVSTAAIRLWAESGDLKARVTAGGHRRFKLDDVKAFAVKKNIQLNISTSSIPKILIVDDDIDFANFLKTLLEIELKNIEIAISIDGFDAANKLRDFAPSIMLLDIKMPGLDGFQVCQHVKQEPSHNHIRVVALSGDASIDDIKRIKSMGAEACLRKPIDPPELFKQLALDENS